MNARKILLSALIVACVAALIAPAWGQDVRIKGRTPVDKWVKVTGSAAGTNDAAKDLAVRVALRKAVEEACGVFLTSKSKTRDYKVVYDKVFAEAVGYVVAHKVLRTWTKDGTTSASVRVHVSTRKFETDWARIAHTLEQENNPRVIVAINEGVHQSIVGRPQEVKENGIVQAKLEEFLLSKHIRLMDRATTEKVAKRDVLLAAIKNNDQAVAAWGARFKADVVITGRATVKYGKTIKVAGVDMHQFTATLNVRVVQTDSGLILDSKSFGPVTANSLQRGGGADKALAKLATTSAPKLLAAVVEAWRRRANVLRTVQISVVGLDYKMWKVFRAEAGKLRGVQALRLREIVEGVGAIDVGYQFTNENLADLLIELKTVKLKVTEITSNRIKFKVVEKQPE